MGRDGRRYRRNLPRRRALKEIHPQHKVVTIKRSSVLRISQVPFTSRISNRVRKHVENEHTKFAKGLEVVIWFEEICLEPCRLWGTELRYVVSEKKLKLTMKKTVDGSAFMK